MTLQAAELTSKRLELLHEMLPKAKATAMLINPGNPGTAQQVNEARDAAAALGLSFQIVNAATEAELERAFASLSGNHAAGLLLALDAFLINQRERIVRLAAAHRIPTIYPAREFVEDGGLASYAPRWAEMYRWVGVYAGRILKGAKPADLPVQRPTVFELVINAKAAKVLGLALPPNFLARADEAIE